MKTLSRNPVDRMGVYKRYADVPSRDRLYHHAAAYDGRDVWAEYVTESELYERYSSDGYRDSTERAIRLWKEHMQEQDRHHALATPTDIETWCAALLEGKGSPRDHRNPDTVYNMYWTRIAEFYDWLYWHTNYPHAYDPFLMAANEYADNAAGRVWQAKVSKGEDDA